MSLSSFKDLLQSPKKFADAIAQAIAILDEVSNLHQQGYKKIGLTYSANHQQTISIAKTYAENRWFTGTSGGGQAFVIAAIEKLLTDNPHYQSLQHVFRIIPITTCEFAGGAGEVKQEWLDADLNAAENFLKEPGNVLLGWKTNEAQYAVGGGISKMLTTKQNEQIQKKLSKLKEKNPFPPRSVGEG